MQELQTITPKLLINFKTTSSLLTRNAKASPKQLKKAVPARTGFESFLNGTSATYLEDLYNSWLTNPKSVDKSWDSYFRDDDRLRSLSSPKENIKSTHSGSAESVPITGRSGHPSPDISSIINEYMSVQAIISNYQVLGHLVAKINPLEDMFDINDKDTTLSQKLGHYPKEIIKNHKIEPHMLDKPYKLPTTTLIGGQETHLPLKEIIKRLELAYCRHIGVEYMHLHIDKEITWIRERFEVPGITQLSKMEKRVTLKRLAKSTVFEAFLIKKWSAEKKFGAEGGETLIPCLSATIDEAVKGGTEQLVISMAHRGRVNVLSNICKQPLDKIFAQFQGLELEDEGSGDVKYHLGGYAEVKQKSKNKITKIILMANPSHLEISHPVCLGTARAYQFYENDPTGVKVLPILLHGDAAFCGEGIVYETIHMAGLPSYHTGGTVHVVVNNQIGFTTDPKFSRSSFYCTDVGKVINAPIFHVNGDDPEAVAYVGKIAAQWRNTFHKDVIIDLVCYRRFGHNEQDQPMFTQPIMYTHIQKMKNSLEKYSVAAFKQGVTSEAELNAFKQDYEKILEKNLEKVKHEKTMRLSDWIPTPWRGFFKNKDPLKCEPTGVNEDVLSHIAKKFSTPPARFHIHKGLERIFHLRQEIVKNRTADWSLGEALAFGSLLKEGHHVRLSGEDVERGTFSHRHHILHHQTKPNTVYQMLADLYPNQARYSICNSPISEYGILGFEHGYSMADPNALVMWEAQFGDFANNAQAMIDTMIASGQSKWSRQCGMVILLPHGLEGQGPEHSSARIERFLELCDDDEDYLPPASPDFAMKQLKATNWIVANCSNPANYFHITRRQIKLPFRKPLVLITTKSLLRHHEARSSFDDMLQGTEFKRIIPATGPATENSDDVKKLIFCSGKVYYEFKDTVKKQNLEDKIAVTRVEQLCPFPYDLIIEECEKYKNACIYWGQEEHKNSGCWTYVHPRLETAVKGTRDIVYIGRGPSASTASGNKIQYKREYDTLMADVVKLPE